MSPEQCLSKPLDRRSDVFALGAVLYELGTGHRLFRRASELKTLEAICYDPVQPPATIDPTFPDDLARICMRALARRPADRYDTAGDMRRDLLAVVRTRTNSEDPHEALARWMEARFADRIEEKRLLLQRCRSAPGPVYLPAAEVDAEIEVPVVMDDGGSATASAVTRPTPSATRGPRAALVIVGVAAVVATLGLVAMSWRSDPASANATTVATTTVSPTAIVTAASIATDRLHGTQVTPVPETSAAATPSASSSASARQIGRPPVRRPPTNGTTRDFGRFD
jgi:eukaryotic-like serine/threonine-protein kinase